MIQDRHPKMQAFNLRDDVTAEPFADLCARLRREAEERQACDTEHTTALMTVLPADMLRLLERIGA